MRHAPNALVTATLLLTAATAFAAATPAQKCQAGKNTAAGAYAACRQKAEAKFALKGDLAKYEIALDKCFAKFAKVWSKLESKAAGACPSDGDQTIIQNVIDSHTDSIAAHLGGGSLTECPDLDAALLKTGQMLCFNAAGMQVTCVGTGQDGEIQRGVAHALVDNGDGTITDTRTGLMWEKQSDDGGVHDQDNLSTWVNAFAAVAALNTASFAGHTDWRLPNIVEMQSIVNYGAVHPTAFAAFNTGCAASCTVTTCSCTQSTFTYWTSTTYQNFPTAALYVDFSVGISSFTDKDNTAHVRAVRDASGT
jgi:hypothetical protein